MDDFRDTLTSIIQDGHDHIKQCVHTMPSYLIGSTEQVSDNPQARKKAERDARDEQSMADTYAVELHDVFTRKQGLCDFCHDPISDIANAIILHVNTQPGFRPILVHDSEYLAATMANAGAQGFLRMGWSKKRAVA